MAGTNLLLFDGAACLIIAFGLVFVVISTDPVRYRPFVLVLIIAKPLSVAVAASFLTVYEAENGQAPSLAVSESLFTCSFWRYCSTPWMLVGAFCAQNVGDLAELRSRTIPTAARCFRRRRDGPLAYSEVAPSDACARPGSRVTGHRRPEPPSGGSIPEPHSGRRRRYRFPARPRRFRV